MQLGLRPRLKARPSLVDLLERARSPPASPATEAATPPLARASLGARLAQLEEAAVQALDQPLPTSPTSDDKDLSTSTSISTVSSFGSPSHSSTPLSPQQLPPTPTISISLPKAEAAQKSRSPEKTVSVNMAPVRRSQLSWNCASQAPSKTSLLACLQLPAARPAVRTKKTHTDTRGREQTAMPMTTCNMV